MSSIIDITSFSIEFLDRLINCTVPEGVYIHNVFELHPPVEHPDASLIIEECSGPPKGHIEKKNGSIDIKITSEEAFNMNIFRSYIGFLIHRLTPAVFLHGCGIYSIVKQKGIIITGHEGSGKTVLSRQIPTSYIIDDDQILLRGNELISIGNKAAHTVRKGKSQQVIYEKTKHLNAGLGLVFMLTKEIEGGIIKKVPAESILKDASLIWHHNLSSIKQPENYCEGKTVPDVSAFIIGTNENRNRTIEAMLEIIGSVL